MSSIPIPSLTDATHVVEVGIGDRVDLAATLVRTGVSVTATDIRKREVPAGVRFVRDDITAPDLHLYADADLLYARRLPRELQAPAAGVARHHGIDFYFTSLGFEWPAIRSTRLDVPGERWYRTSAPTRESPTRAVPSRYAH